MSVRNSEKPELPVADYPTGLNFKLQYFEDAVLLQQQQRGKSQILWIVGLGGVGKTTFAKHFFNMKKSDYHRSGFLFEVRDSAAKNSLNSWQRILLKAKIFAREIHQSEWKIPMENKPFAVILETSSS